MRTNIKILLLTQHPTHPLPRLPLTLPLPSQQLNPPLRQQLHHNRAKLNLTELLSRTRPRPHHPRRVHGSLSIRTQSRDVELLPPRRLVHADEASRVEGRGVGAPARREVRCVLVHAHQGAGGDCDAAEAGGGFYVDWGWNEGCFYEERGGGGEAEGFVHEGEGAREVRVGCCVVIVVGVLYGGEGGDVLGYLVEDPGLELWVHGEEGEGEGEG